MSKHPLIEALGLETGTNAWNQRTVLADELERVLEQAPLVTGLKAGPQEENLSWWQSTDATLCAHTHTARLVCIQPTKAPDTAEALLLDYIAKVRTWAYNIKRDEYTVAASDVVKLENRARKLLEGK